MVAKKPPGIQIIGSNWFHDGWISGILGLPQLEDVHPENPIPQNDIEAWNEGYDMAVETHSDLRATFSKMVETGQIIVC